MRVMSDSDITRDSDTDTDSDKWPLIVKSVSFMPCKETAYLGNCQRHI